MITITEEQKAAGCVLPIKYTYVVRVPGGNPATTEPHEDLSKLLRAAYKLAKQLIANPVDLANEKERIKVAIAGIRDHLAEINRQKQPDPTNTYPAKLGYGQTMLIPGRNPALPASKDYAYQKYRKQLKKLQMENQQ